jgi:membrane-associated phospholipid phosphatase
MVVVSYAAFVTYYLFPAMPPWMASQQGFLPPVAHIMDQVLAHFANPISLPTVYNYVGANLVAAVPSLHAAYPLIAALFINKKYHRWGWLMFLYPLCMALAVMYLGEHYFFDIVAATIYVFVAYIFITNWRGINDKIKKYISWFYNALVPAEKARGKANSQ